MINGEIKKTSICKASHTKRVVADREKYNITETTPNSVATIDTVDANNIELKMIVKKPLLKK